MAVNSYWFGKTIANAFGGETEEESKRVDYLTDEIRVMLCTSSYTPNQDAHETKADITNEISGAIGYDAGGAILDTKSIVYVSDTNTTQFKAANVTWASSTITARYAVIYDNTPVDDDQKVLLGYIDFGENKSSDNGDFTIQWHADGILKSVAA